MTKLLMTSFTALALITGMSAASAQMMPESKKAIAVTEARVGDIKPVHNEAELRAGLIGPGTMSLMASKMALNKATNPKVMEFAMFETDEQTALGMILKELNTPAAPMSDKDKAMAKKLEGAAKGRDFDVAYITGQIEGHETLLMITESYLKNADLKSMEPKEMEARHLAYFIKAAIKQHIANTTDIMTMMK